jgi:ABC-type bacteriocin/lantibiotic exporter with double-glycine peptidase domain
VKLTPYKQEEPHTCAVACLRMIAAHFNIHRNEAELLSLCGTTLHGTMAEDLAEAASTLGLSAKISYDEPEFLSQTLSHSLPLTVYIGLPRKLAPDLVNIHSVVVIALEKSDVVYLDPLDGLEHRQPVAAFFTSWGYAYHLAILITPSS